MRLTRSAPRRRSRALATALAASLALASAAPAQAEDAADNRRLAFSVTGEAAAAPDKAVIMVGVGAEARSASDAMAQQAERMTVVLQTAARAGIETGDIETTSLSLTPVYNSQKSYDGPPEVVGYRATNMVAITLHALDQVGPTLDQLVSAGADRIEGVRFELEDPSALQTQARLAAVEALRERRRFYVEDAGLPLGPMLQLQEGGGGPVMENGPMMRMTQSATPVAPGDITASVTLHAVYRLGDTE